MTFFYFIEEIEPSPKYTDRGDANYYKTIAS